MTKNNYTPEAYNLILEVLNATVGLIRDGKIEPVAPYANDRATDESKHEFHISGRELLMGFRIYAKEQYGNMALLLLERWGLKSTEDVGNIVFEMVEKGRMSKRENDSIDDFKDNYDFINVFGSDQTMED